MATTTFDPIKAAHYLAEAHVQRSDYANLPEAIAPGTITDAYLVQDALREIWTPARGAIAGYKIATTTKVMQALMGIDHPCQGNIFAKTVHASPAHLRLADYINLVIECELCVRLGSTLDAKTPYTAETVAGAIKGLIPAFELIEDRRANYKQTKVHTLIADNAWNAGVVLGPDAAAYLVPRCERSYVGVEVLVAAIDRISMERKAAPTQGIWREALEEVLGPREPRLL